MNEYTVLFLNGITAYIMAEDWKDIILEAKMYAERRDFFPNIKFIIDEDGTTIKDININTLQFKFTQCLTSVEK